MTSHDAGRITKKPKKQSETLSEAAADIDHIFSTSNNIQKQNTKAASIALTQNDAACPKTKTITDSASSKSLAKNKKTENTKTSNNITATPVTAASDALFTDTRGLTTGSKFCFFCVFFSPQIFHIFLRQRFNLFFQNDAPPKKVIPFLHPTNLISEMAAIRPIVRLTVNAAFNML